MSTEYLTVKEFAEAAGVSPQTIYKQINSRLAPYVQTIGGQKKIAAAALREFYNAVEQPNSTENQPKTTENNPNSTQIQPDSTFENQPDSTENQLDSAIEQRVYQLEKMLQEQIEADRQEKEFLREQIRQKDKTIEDLAENLKIAQQLAAADKKKLLELEELHEKEVIREDNENIIKPYDNENEDAEINISQNRGIFNFFKRLIKK